MLGDGSKKVRTEILESIVKIGDRRALAPLLSLYKIVNSDSSSTGQLIRDAFREICKRDKISLQDQVFANVPQEDLRILQKLIPRTKAPKVPPEEAQIDSARLLRNERCAS